MTSTYQGVKLEHREANRVNHSDTECKDIKYDVKWLYFFHDQLCRTKVPDKVKHSIPQTTWIQKKTYYNPCKCKPENILFDKLLLIKRDLLEFYSLVPRKFW